MMAALFYAMAIGIPSSAMSADPIITEVTEKDNGRELVVPRESVLEVKLETSLGTGYGWEVAKIDTDLLEPLGDSIVPASAEVLLGGKEIHIFRYKAQAVGDTILRMQYLRRWEKEVSPLKIYQIKLQIR